MSPCRHPTPTRHFPLGPHDPQKLTALRDRLIQVGYTQAGLVELLGSERPLHFRRRDGMLPLHVHRTRHGSPLASLARLFHLGYPVPVAAADTALAPFPLIDCVAMGLVQLEDGNARAVAELIPYEGLILAADWCFGTCAGPCQVMGVAASTRTLAALALWPRGKRVLDLGTGCGVLALLGRTRGNEVAAVDCNTRAIQFSQWNMDLNGLSSVGWQTADFFAPLGGQTFDLVLCNPPFVISPRSEVLHSDSGRPTDQLCESLIRAAPQWLSAGGCFQMVFNWVQRRDEDWRFRLAGWCRGTGCDGLLLYSHVQDAAEYALDRLHEIVETPEEQLAAFDRWMAYYQQHGIQAIGFGLMTLRRTARREPWFHAHQFCPGEHPDREVVRRAFAHGDFLRTHPTDASLLQARLRRADRLFRQQKHAFSNGDWTLIESRLGVTGGPCPIVAATEVVELIAWCDGTQPVGAYLTKTRAARQNLRTAEFAVMLRRLLEIGLLEPVTHETCGRAE